MKAAVLYGKEDVRVEDVQPQPLKPGEVRIQIEAALTCGTDLKVFRRGYHAKMIVPPAVFGHELAGSFPKYAKVRSGRSAIAWWWRIRRLVGSVFIAKTTRKIFATICCF